MNILVNTSVLARELRLLNTVVPVKPTLPILANVLIRADMGQLDFYATDYEIGFRTTCAATVQEPGAVTIPAKRLLDITEHLPDAELQIVTDQGHTRLTCGGFKSRLQTMSAEDFPVPTTMQGDRHTLDTAQLHQLIHRVEYAISEKVKFTVNGALFQLTENVAALVATDTRRLAIATMRYAAASPVRVTIPKKTLDALLTLFTEGPLEFATNGRHLFFAAQDQLLISRTIDAEFPKYERIIPKNDKKIALDRVTLTAVLRRVSLLSDTNQFVTMAFGANTVAITSSSADAGDAFECLSTPYDGVPITLCVNWRHVLDFLEVASEPVVTVEIKDETSPLLLSDGATFINVVLVSRRESK